MNQLLTLVIVVAVFLIIILAGRKDRVGKADKVKESGKKEREDIWLFDGERSTPGGGSWYPVFFRE